MGTGGILYERVSLPFLKYGRFVSFHVGCLPVLLARDQGGG